MKYTVNYGFKKPEPLETRNINDINESFDLVDAKLKETQDKNTNLQATFEQLVINAGNSNAEIVAGRQDNITGQTYKSLPDRLDNVSSDLEAKANMLTEIQQAFEIRNIKNAIEIDESKNLVAHVSNIAFSKNGKAYCIYLCDKVNKIESANNQETEIWLSIFNIGDPSNKTFKKICGIGTSVQWYTVKTYAPYNPNIVYNSATNEIFVFVFAHFILDGTTPDTWSYLLFKINPDTDEFVMDASSGKIATFGLNITYNSVSYQINNTGISDLLVALGYPVTNPVMQMTCNFVYKVVDGYGYYYTILGGINFKQIIVRTINFKNYEYVKIIDDGLNVSTPEASLQFISDTKMIILYRSDDTNNRGVYLATYDINTKTFEYKGKYSNSASKPLIIKDYNNNIYSIYNVPWSKNAIFERRGINVDLYDIVESKFNNIYHNEYPYNIHYFAYALYGTEIYLTFTSGKKFVRFGDDHDSIQMITFGS